MIKRLYWILFILLLGGVVNSTVSSSADNSNQLAGSDLEIFEGFSRLFVYTTSDNSLDRATTFQPSNVGAPYQFDGVFGHVKGEGGDGLIALHECLNSNNYFLSTDPQCEITDESFNTQIGFIYTTNADGRTPLYRCYSGTNHYISATNSCRGSDTLEAGGNPLGFVKSATIRTADGAVGGSSTPGTTAGVTVVNDINAESLLGSDHTRLKRHFNPTSGDHWITVPTLDSVAAGYNFERNLGHMRKTNTDGATRALYSCVSPSGNHFLSAFDRCGHNNGNTVNTILASGNPIGFLWENGGEHYVEVFKCRVGTDGSFFASVDSNCEGQSVIKSLGFTRRLSFSAVQNTVGTTTTPTTTVDTNDTYVALYRLFNDVNDHWITAESSLFTVPVNYRTESILGFARRTSGGGTDRELFDCQVSGSDHRLVTNTANCPSSSVNKIGNIWSAVDTGRVELFSCISNGDYFATTDTNCEGAANKTSLGFIQSSDNSNVGKILTFTTGVGVISSQAGLESKTSAEIVTECNTRKVNLPQNSRVVCKFGSAFIDEGRGALSSTPVTTPTQTTGGGNEIVTNGGVNPFVMLASYKMSGVRATSSHMDWYTVGEEVIFSDFKPIGVLEATEVPGASLLYGCKVRFGVMHTLDETCEGVDDSIRKIEGYIWNENGDGRVPLYRCAGRTNGKTHHYSVTNPNDCGEARVDGGGQPIGFVNAYTANSFENFTQGVVDKCGINQVKAGIEGGYEFDLYTWYSVFKDPNVRGTIKTNFSNSDCKDYHYTSLSYEDDLVGDDFLQIWHMSGLDGTPSFYPISDFFGNGEGYMKIGDKKSKVYTIAPYADPGGSHQSSMRFAEGFSDGEVREDSGDEIDNTN